MVALVKIHLVPVWTKNDAHSSAGVNWGSETHSFLEATLGVRHMWDNNAHLLILVLHMDPLQLDLNTLLFGLAWTPPGL